ncbi:MAG TPA: 3-hydroxyacyl-CoA dehydrogenase NAD-binding domain-containing protein [Polyangiaceae bacterium]|nr:3-hydroxyacyl-CoA dehydrogenase NAD-binding domain-containing protein [Polyangiaceae bacterium]
MRLDEDRALGKDPAMLTSEIGLIAVIGAGQMGAGIAQVCAQRGYRVLLADAALDRAERAKAGIEKQLERLRDKGKLSAEACAQVSARLEPSTAEHAFPEADLVIEAATENRELKLALFEQADALAKPQAILASNTSSISITALAGRTKRADRVIGMHFMNPVPVMKLVELVRGLSTSEATLTTVRALSEALGKTVILSQDRPGFLVNRMLIPFLNEACFALQEGTGSAEDIDQGARLGLNHPLGPLELADLIGLDTVLAIARVLEQDFGDPKYRAPVLLKNLVAAGHLGRKTKRGFYAYDDQGKKLEPRP